MAKKPNSLIGIKRTENYLLKLQDVMNSIPGATVVKQIDGEFIDGEDMRWTKWFVGDEIVVYAGTRHVKLVNAAEEESHYFYMKIADYENFVKACELRRKEMVKELSVKKK